MNTIGERLREAIEQWPSDTGGGGNVKEFERRMLEQLGGDKQKSGASYTSLYRYFRGEQTPSVEFLQTAAKVLGVRSAWLFSGQGEMTDSEESERLRQRYSELDRPVLEAIRDRHPWFRQLAPDVQYAFTGILRRLETQAPGGRQIEDVDGGQEERLELSEDLLTWLTLPLRSWGFYEPKLLRGEETLEIRTGVLNQYLRSALTALSAAVTFPLDRGEGFDRRPTGLLASVRRGVERDELPTPSEEEQQRARHVQDALDELCPVELYEDRFERYDLRPQAMHLESE